MLPFLLAGLGLGALRGADSKMKAAAERKYQATTAAYSPWTGLQSHDVKEPSMLMDLASGAMTGAQFGQGLETAAANKEMAGLQRDKLLLGNQKAASELVSPGGTNPYSKAFGLPASNSSLLNSGIMVG